jgi:5-(carboxyamino)imidazole ribonucleotide synthase
MVIRPEPAAAMPGDGAPIVGMIGGGQLARMTAAAAAALGVGFRVLANSNDEPAAQVVRDTWIGSHLDAAAVSAFSAGCTVVTFDHEHVPAECLAAAAAAGAAVRPGPRALALAQDKSLMRQQLTALGHPCPRWTVLEEITHAGDFAAEVGWPIIVKTSRGGYDGRGVWRIHDQAGLDALLAQELPTGACWLLEECVPFDQELCAQVARSPSGQAVAYPVVRTRQVDGMCAEVIAPAPELDESLAMQAQQIALRIAGDLEVVGMLAVEMFQSGDELTVNELAMRPHNSGHWSIEGAFTSQFENHLRAVLDLPLGDPGPRSQVAVMVNVIGTDAPDLYSGYRHVLARDPQLNVHLYGKSVRPGRKLGHVTLVGSHADADAEALLARAQHAAHYLSGIIDE